MITTGWPPGLLQDDDRGLSRWLASRPDARYQLRKNMSRDEVEWLEKGNAEWRSLALSNQQQARAAQATARIAITHLQAVLNKARTHAEQQAADTAARDWLISIGSEPT